MYTNEAINKVAEIVLKILNFSKPAYDPIQAVNILGGKIFYDIKDDCTDAYIEKSNEETFDFSIHLNENKPFSRTRFSIAHELGHLFLHMGYKTNRWDTAEAFQDSIYYRIYNRKNMNYSQEESEANEFAAAFLMPKEQFKVSFISNKFDLSSTAEEYKVSVEAAKNRAKILGLIG